MEQVIKEMQGLKESISTAEIDAATSEGRLSSSLERLKKDFKQSSLEAGEKTRKKNEEALQLLKEKIVGKFKALKEEYEF